MGNHPKSNINTLHVRYVVLKAVALSAIWCNGSKSNLRGAYVVHLSRDEEGQWVCPPVR